MAETKRAWRTPASYDAEQITRDAIEPLLLAYGFTDVRDQRKRTGSATIQMASCTSPSGVPMIMRVKLCWRFERNSGRSRDYSAFQITSKLINADWEETVSRQAKNYKSTGATHVLAVQPGLDRIELAAVIPLDKLREIWCRQDQIGEDLVNGGKAGKLKHSPARNGQSPTLFLVDDRTPYTHAIADALWSFEGVINVTACAPSVAAVIARDDSLADCPGEPPDLGRDTGQRVTQVRSGFRRDEKVRRAVLERANGNCERAGCGQARDFPGFFDVHHILGVGLSDRPWSCVALCPNCHRDAHYGPDANRINVELKDYAARFARDLPRIDQ